MMRLTPLSKISRIYSIKVSSKNIINRNDSKFIFYATNLKKFSDSFQNENFRSAKTSNSQSIEDIMGNSQKPTYGNSMSNQTYNQTPKKRSRLSFLRDGMIISFYLRKNPIAQTEGFKNDGYVFLELREFTENFSSDRNANKDPRFMIMKSIALAKFLLLNPKSYCKEKELENIKITQKFRDLDIQQNSDNKYTFTLKVMPKDDSERTQGYEDNARNENSLMVSQIELNPEDMIILQRFVNKCLDELLNY